MFRPLSFLALLLAFLTGGHAEIGAPLVDEFGRTRFGTRGLGWSATQLRDGRLLFGFDDISVFDGVDWTTHAVPETYAIRALDAAPDGTFWIGGVNAVGYGTPEGGGFRFHSLTPQLPAELQGRIGDVWNVFADGPGRAIFVATAHVLEWTGHTFIVHPLEAAPRLAGFRLDGRVHIGHRPTGLRVLGRDGLETVLTATQLRGAGVLWGDASGGRPIFATTSGLRELRDGELVPFAPALDAWMLDNILTCATRLPDGRIAVGTLKGGTMLVEADGSGAQPLQLDANVSTEAVHALLTDAEGCLWVVCPAGLFRVRATRAIAAVQLPRAAAYPVRASVPLRDGALVASDTALWRVAETADGDRLYQIPGFRERVLALMPQGAEVLVAHRGGVSAMQADGTVKLLHAFAGDVFALARDESGRLFAALGHRAVELSAAGAIEIPGAFPDVPGSLAALPSGTLVAGTYSAGLAIIGPAHPGASTLAAELAGDRGRAFVAPAGPMLYAARGRTVAVLPAPDRPSLALRLPEGTEVKALAAGEGGRAWIACERPLAGSPPLPLLYRIDVGAARLTATPLRLDPLHHAGALHSLSAHEAQGETTLWLGGESALLHLRPSDLPQWTAPAAPRLQLVTPLPHDRTRLLLPYKGNRLELDLLTPEPGRRPAVRLQTRIEGIGGDWSDPHEHKLVLANLQHGDYRVQARFIAADDSTSPVATLAFTVAPPWWLTPWALGLQFASAAFAVFGFVRLRLNSLRRRALRLEKLVAERTEQLARASEAKSEFVSGMSHELRNPLNGIVASAQALDEHGLDEEQRRLLATVRHCAGLLDALIGDVLDLAEIESGTIKLRHRNYVPADIVAAAAAIMRPIAERKGLRLTDHVEPGVAPLAHGDAFRIQQVLLNLLGNAVKYSDRGEIRLVLRARSAGDAGAQLEFEVRDEGPGVSEKEQQKLFAKFSRLPSAHEKGVPGIGLGLALCRELVTRMGGAIGVESAPGAGSTFRFTVPVGAVSPGSETEGALDDFAPPRTALVIEDLDYNARAMTALLERLQCRADTAGSGAAALAKLREARFDVAFIDYDLPDTSGPALARTIAEQHPAAKPVLIAMTAYADEATRKRCRAAGMEAFIVKPVTRQKLHAALAQIAQPAAGAQAPVEPVPPPAPGPGTTPALDLRQLELIGSTPADRYHAAQRLGEMIQTDIGLLRQTAEAGDFTSAASAAHRIVSHARFVGARALAMLAEETQRSAQEEPELALDLLPATETQARLVVAALHALQP